MRCALAAALLVSCAAAARAADTAPPPTPAPSVRAVRTSGPIVVDGVLDEPVWKTDNAITSFSQADPRRGEAASQSTEVRVAYDDAAVYVGARMHDAHPDSIVARLSRRDNQSGSDLFTVYFDTFSDRRTGYYFGVTAAGTQYDGILMNDNWDDDSWDGVWSARIRRDGDGWTAEMRIPFSQMRSSGAKQMVWGINFERYLSRRNENDKLAYAPLGQSGFVSRFPSLGGLDGIRATRKLEVLPYATSKAEYLTHDPGDPYHGGSHYGGASGLDLRTSLGSKFTLNATVNPDFGQVEIDPAVVNLSDVETYFSEKRPFFTEGLSVFRCGNNGASDYWNFNWPEPTFFYSRRLGRAPQGQLPANTVFSDVPLATHILGAVKITGQPAARWNFGMVNAVTEKEVADYQLDDGSRGSAVVEPLTYYGVLRGIRTFHDERQGLGVMTMETARALSGTGLADQLNRNSTTTALDGWTFLDRKKNWVLSGYATGTHVEGTPARIASLENSPRHYYQRPDRDDLGVDADATSLDGYGARVWVNKENGPWMSNSAIGFLSPGFENNDLGFNSRADVINGHAGVGYNWNKPNAWKKYFWVLGALGQGWNFAGQHTSSLGYIAATLEQINAWSWRLNSNLYARTLNDRITRGGPAMVNPEGVGFDLSWDTNSQAKTFLSLSTGTNSDRGGSREWYANPGMTWKPRANISFAAGPTFDQTHNDAQYVTQVSDPAATSTFGGRYVFAELDQTTLGAEVRMDLSITPNLSLQLYAQPLISSGRYSQYKELSQPGSYDFLVYGTGGSTIDPATGTVDPDGAGPAAAFGVGRPDFTYRTVRGNAVLRWEYLPGSTAFLVWTQDRTGVTDDGRFDLSPSLSALSRTPANNRILVKLSHHFEL